MLWNLRLTVAAMCKLKCGLRIIKTQQKMCRKVHSQLQIPSCSLPAAVSTPGLLCAEGDFTPSGGRGKGYVQFITMLTALDPKAGYLGEGHLTIGVHICLSVTNMVMTAACRNGVRMCQC